jgi:hypothetical protein
VNYQQPWLTPRYTSEKAAALRELRHAIEQIEKDHHYNALFSTSEAMLSMQRCIGEIRHHVQFPIIAGESAR